MLLLALSLAALSAPAPALDADWIAPFERADLLFSPESRPDFETLTPMENCTGCEWANGTCTRQHDTNCSALWWPGLGNGFLGGIAQAPTLRIAGFFSGDYGRYTAGKTIPPVASDGFSNKQLAYRASIPAFASSIIVSGPALRPETARAALNVRDAVYYERTALEGGGRVEIRQFMHQTRRNLVVVDITLDCTNCTQDTELAMRAASSRQAAQSPDVTSRDQTTHHARLWWRRRDFGKQPRPRSRRRTFALDERVGGLASSGLPSGMPLHHTLQRAEQLAGRRLRRW